MEVLLKLIGRVKASVGTRGTQVESVVPTVLSLSAAGIYSLAQE